jgi:hypothetical protein
MYQVSFGYRSPLKTSFLQGGLKIKEGAYGGKITESNVSLEHIRPHSRGGASTISNFLLVTQKENGLRGNMPFDVFIRQNSEKVKTIQTYLDTLRGTIINGVDYVKVVVKTLNREVRQNIFR